MDELGFAPLALICCYPAVAYYNVPITEIVVALEAMQSDPKAPQPHLIVDVNFQTVKLKEKYEMVRFCFLI
jgi:hypothetical protein